MSAASFIICILSIISIICSLIIVISSTSAMWRAEKAVDNDCSKIRDFKTTAVC